MSRLTLPQLRRRLDGAVEILRPAVTGQEAIAIITGLLFLKYAHDTWADGDSNRPGLAASPAGSVAIASGDTVRADCRLDLPRPVTIQNRKE